MSGTRSAGRMGDPGDKAGWGTLVPSGNVAPVGEVGTHRSPGSARGLCRAGWTLPSRRQGQWKKPGVGLIKGSFKEEVNLDCGIGSGLRLDCWRGRGLE